MKSSISLLDYIITSDHTQARMWAKRARDALKVLVNGFNRVVVNDTALKIDDDDPVLLLLSIALIRVGDICQVWSNSQSISSWSNVAQQLVELSSQSFNHSVDQSTYSSLFPCKLQQVSKIIMYLSEEELDKLNTHLSFSTESVRSALDELMLFYEGLLTCKCEKIEKNSTQLTLNTSGTLRKRTGAHFTPRSIVKLMVHELLNDIKQRFDTPRSLVSLRICDPSLGAGTFLLEVGEQIAQYMSQALGETRSHQEILSHVFMNCLYGIELNERSCELARFILWMRCGGGDEVLDALRKHLIHGDALQPSIHNSFSQELKISFDLVIGNPPYVAFYGRGSQAKYYPQSYIERLKHQHSHIDQHAILSGRLNLFLSFCALAHQLASSSRGIVSLVLPDSVLTNESYEPLRRALIHSRLLRSVTLYDDSIFSGAVVGACVVLWERHQMTENEVALDSVQVTLRYLTHRNSQTNQPKTSKVKSAVINDAVIQQWEESHSQLSNRPMCSWYPISSATLNQHLVSGKEVVSLDEVAWVRDGFNTGTATRRTQLLSTTKISTQTHNLELLSPCPCLEGKSIAPYQIHSTSLWIRLPVTISPQNLAFYQSIKIIYRQTANRPIAAVDLEGCCYLNSAHSIILKNSEITKTVLSNQHHLDTTLHALCAYLNSERCARYYQALSGERRSVFPQIHVSTMRKLKVPISIFDPHNQITHQLAQCAKQLTKLSNDATQTIEATLERDDLLACIEKLVLTLLSKD